MRKKRKTSEQESIKLTYTFLNDIGKYLNSYIDEVLSFCSIKKPDETDFIAFCFNTASIVPQITLNYYLIKRVWYPSQPKILARGRYFIKKSFHPYQEKSLSESDAMDILTERLKSFNWKAFDFYNAFSDENGIHSIKSLRVNLVVNIADVYGEANSILLILKDFFSLTSGPAEQALHDIYCGLEHINDHITSLSPVLNLLTDMLSWDLKEKDEKKLKALLMAPKPTARRF